MNSVGFSIDKFIQVFQANQAEFFTELFRHISMTSLAILISLLIGVPLGILITRNKTLAKAVIGFANVMQSIPCIALMALAVVFMGIGTAPAILMVFVYAFLPILKNTYTGIMSVDPKNLETARGLGLSRTRCLFKIELPIAAPFIMAGIRIAAVSSVGTMTIAAFAGAKGLGWFINLGLGSLNTEMILLGTIPVALLALLVDFLFSVLEKAVTREGLLPADQIVNLSPRSLRLRKLTAALVCFVLIGSALVQPLSGFFKKEKDTIVVGATYFTEVYILGNIYAELIEANTDLEVETNFGLTSGAIAYTAMEKGDIDMFVDYTAIALTDILHEPIKMDPEECYQEVVRIMAEEHGVHTSKPLGYNNTYVLAVKPETAEKYHISTISELMARAPELILGCTMDFINYQNCLPNLRETFGTDFKEVHGLDTVVRYTAVDSGQTDVVDAYATDALMSKLGLVAMKDDTNFFPPYDAVNFVNQKTLDRHPELVPLLSKLDGLINDETMSAMNAMVDLDGMTAEEVAHQFLTEHGLVPEE